MSTVPESTLDAVADGSYYAPHDVLPGFRDAQRHFIVYPRILEVRVPGDDRYAADAAGRTLAQRSIQAQQEQAQRQEARDAWSWPYIVLHYKMVAPHFEEILSKARLGEPK